MCHFLSVCFVALTKLFLLISKSQIQLWWKLQPFTGRIMEIVSIDSSARKGTVQSSMEHQWLQAVGYYCYREQGQKWDSLSLPLSLQNRFTLAGGETGPCCRWGMLLCYKHTTTLDPLVTDDYRFGFICSPLLQKWCYKINSKGSTRTNWVILYSFNVPDYCSWPGQLSFTFSHEIVYCLFCE